MYSFGIGWNVSFDLAMINNFGADVYAFDPTPNSIKWAKENIHNSNFHIYSYGISDKDGTEKFHLAEAENFVSGSIDARAELQGRCIDVQMKTLASIMKDLGHDYIDLLKMDIEGSEFKVIPNILESKIKFGQLCIETHQRFYEDRDARIKKLISELNNAGYFIASVSPSYNEITFIPKN